MRGREKEQGGIESLLISIAVHLAVILLVPYAEQPVLEVYPLDIAGVIEIATVETAPAAPAPAPGVSVQEVTPKPKPAAPEPAKLTPAPTPKPEPKPEPKVAPKPEPAKEEPPKQQAPVKQDKPEVVTSPAGKTPPPAADSEPPKSAQPEPEPTPEPQATQVGATTSPPGPGQPDGAGTIPRPEYPGDDPTGLSMIRSTGGDDHGVWIPKGVQNLRGRGEALVRIRIKADGSMDTISFLEPPPDSAMTQAIRTAISTAWRFGKDSAPGRADDYCLDVRVGYDGGTMDVWVKSERASYVR